MSNRRKQLRKALFAKPPNKTPSEGQQHPAGEGPNKNTDENNKDKIIPADKKPPIIVVLEIVGTLVGGALASLFAATTHIIACIWCVWFASFSALALVSHYVGQSSPAWKTRAHKICAVAMVFITVWFVIWSYNLYISGKINPAIFHAEMTLRPGDTVDPKDPFATRFTLKNINPFTISNLQYHVAWVDGYTNGDPNENRQIMKVVNPKEYWVPELKPEREADLIFTPAAKFKYPEAIAMQVYLYYNPGPHGFISRDIPHDPEIFEFYTRKDASGNYKWFFSDQPVKAWTSNYVTIMNRVHYSGYAFPAVLPVVNVSLGEHTNPKDPLAQVVVVDNQGPGPIKNLICELDWPDPKKQPTEIDAVIIAGTPFLEPEKKQPIHCYGINGLPTFGPKTFVNFDIEYEAAGFGFRTNECFTYCIVQDTNGAFTWLPAGEGKPIREFLADLQKKSQNRQSNTALGNTN